MNFKAILVVTAVSWVAIAGDILLKLEGQKPQAYWPVLILASFFYALTAFGWFYVLRLDKLAVVIAGLYPAIQSISCVILGYLVFGEILTLREAAGIACALLATFLLVVK